MKRIVKLKEKFILTEADPAPTSSAPAIKAATLVTNTAQAGVNGINNDPKNSSSKNSLDAMKQRQEANWDAIIAKIWPQHSQLQPDGTYKDDEIATNIKQLGKAFKVECMEKGFDRGGNAFIRFIDKTIVAKKQKITAAQYGAIHNAYVDQDISDANLDNKAYPDLTLIKGHDILWADGFFNFTAQTISGFLNLQATAIARAIKKKQTAESAKMKMAIEQDIITVLYRDASGKIPRSLADAQISLNRLFPENKDASSTATDADAAVTKAGKGGGSKLPTEVASIISMFDKNTAITAVAAIAAQTNFDVNPNDVKKALAKHGITGDLPAVTPATASKYKLLISKLTKETALPAIRELAKKATTV